MSAKVLLVIALVAEFVLVVKVAVATYRARRRRRSQEYRDRLIRLDGDPL